jgi:rod shape-determining protein MreC
VPAETTTTVGDVVLTSGMGGVYPKGLVVGDVTDILVERHRLFPTIIVESRVSISDTEEVLVIFRPLPAVDLGGGE